MPMFALRVTFLFFVSSLIVISSGHNLNVSAASTEAKAAIIIDDFGGIGKGSNEFLTHNIPVTVAVMPFLENSRLVAKKAHEAGFEVMIHMPMEPKQGKKSWLGPNPILDSLTDEEIRSRVREAIDDVPYASGINQHMGSKIVENEQIMTIILEVAKEHNLYVIDSGTNPNSCIPKLCEQTNMLYGERDLFLDNTQSSRHHTYKMAIKLAELAEQNGQAIGIGHVGIKGLDTFHALQEAKPYFAEKNVDIVPVSHLLKSPIDKDPWHFWEEGL
ncbi:divergent polysaccharide deacetylase family protein [Bacillus sp. A116_S68]|nr:divergent polysaccharide deacetylase family protein [Bacillus sp. A116_S68]